MPIPLAALSAGASLLGGLFQTGQHSPDWGQLGSNYINQFGNALGGQFNNFYNSGPLAQLTLGANDPFAFANLAGQRFQASPAYSALLANLGAASNSTAEALRGRAALGAGTGIGLGAGALGNLNTGFNMALANARAQQYLQAQQQFGALQAQRQSGAMGLTSGAAGLAGNALSQYQQRPNFLQQLGGGLTGLGAAGLNYSMLQGLGAQSPTAGPWQWGPQQQSAYWQGAGGTGNTTIRPRV